MSSLTIEKSFKFSHLHFFAFVMLYIIQLTYTYAGWLYTVIMLTAIGVTLFLTLKYNSRFSNYCMIACAYCVVVPTIIGLIHGVIQDALMCCVSLLLPFAFSYKSIDFTDAEKSCYRIAALTILLDLFRPYIPMLASMNSNGYSFMLFMAFTSVIMLVSIKKSFVTVFLLFYCVYIFTTSESRNAFFIFIIAAILSLLPYKVLCNKVFYRIMYLVSFLYQVFSTKWLEFVEKTPLLSSLFDFFADHFFKKAWGVESRVDFYDIYISRLWRENPFTLLVGTGETHHMHNGFAQMLYPFGLIGTILIMVMYIFIFEMGYKLVSKNENRLIMGTIISLCGLWLLQGADAFLIGAKSCVFLPYFLVAIVLRGYMDLPEEERYIIPWERWKLKRENIRRFGSIRKG